LPTPKGLILVAEGDKDLRSTLMEFLESEGFDVLGVSNATEAVETIRASQRRPDVLVLDLNISVLSGWNFLAMRLADPILLLIPVVVLSDEADAPPEAPRSTFLKKPVDLDKLAVVVRRVLDESTPDAQRSRRRSEPWSVDEKRPNVVRNSFGHVVAFIGSERQARRIVAAVNSTSRISTEALEQGIVRKGLECLYRLNRYDSDEAYRREVDGGTGLASIIERRAEIARMLGDTTFSESERRQS
jgi:DNA-binding response OmpR family regulator